MGIDKIKMRENVEHKESALTPITAALLVGLGGAVLSSDIASAAERQQTPVDAASATHQVQPAGKEDVWARLARTTIANMRADIKGRGTDEKVKIVIGAGIDSILDEVAGHADAQRNADIKAAGAEVGRDATEIAAGAVAGLIKQAIPELERLGRQMETRAHPEAHQK